MIHLILLLDLQLLLNYKLNNYKAQENHKH